MNRTEMKEKYQQAAIMFLCEEAEHLYARGKNFEEVRHLLDGNRVFSEWIKENVEDWEDLLAEDGLGLSGTDIRLMNDPPFKGGAPYFKGTWCNILQRELCKMFEILVDDVAHWIDSCDPCKPMSQSEEDYHITKSQFGV